MSSINDKSKRPNNSDEPESSISIIPDDLLIEILLRLPHSRSATRCAAVCKRWRSLISDGQFGHKFTRHHSDEKQFPFTTTLLLFNDKLSYQIFSHKSKTLHGTAKQFSDSFRYLNFFPIYAKPLACFEDLLLVASSSSSSMEYRVCNPLSRRSLVLPAAPPPRNAVHGIAFKPRSDQVQLRYKVVRLESDRGLTIFCSESGKWTTPSTPLSVPANAASFKASDAVATGDGVLDFPLKTQGGNLAGFLAIDPFDRQIRCGFTGFPAGMAPRHLAAWFAGAVRGRLRVSQSFSVQGGVFHLKIWELVRDGAPSAAPWVSVHDGEVGMDPKARVVRVCGFDPNNGDVIFVVDKCSDIYKYGLEEKSFETVGQIPPPTLSKCLGQPYNVFLRSLTLVHPTWPSQIPPLP